MHLKLNMQISVIIRGYHTAMAFFRPQSQRDLAIRLGQSRICSVFSGANICRCPFALANKIPDNAPSFPILSICLKHARASSWSQESTATTHKPEPGILSWLSDQGSLTQRLVDLCGEHFSVRVLNQQWIRPTTDEARLLKIPTRQIVLLRQVQLLCEQQVMVYARSVIPLRTLQGPSRRLKHLGNKPLGSYLFANPGLQRQQQQLVAVTRNNPLFATALSGNSQDCANIWSRRSLFSLGGKSLLVSEFFLPALFQK